MSPKRLEHIVILCFERHFSKQNSVIRLKSNILPPAKFLGWLRHCCMYKTPLLHRPDDCIGFTRSCPPTFYNKIAPMVMGVVVNICPENVIFCSVKATAHRTFLEIFLNHAVFKGIPRSFGYVARISRRQNTSLIPGKKVRLISQYIRYI